MFTRLSFALGLLSVGIPCAVAQGPAVAAASETAAPVVTAPGVGCEAGFSNITLTNFSEDSTAKATPLPTGELRITARRGWVEDLDKAPVAYRTKEGAKPVEEISVPIHNGAITQTVCLPYTRAYGARPTRYEFTIWDNKTEEDPIMTLTADVTKPQFSLDEQVVYLGGTNDAPAPTPTPAKAQPQKSGWFHTLAAKVPH